MDQDAVAEGTDEDMHSAGRDSEGDMDNEGEGEVDETEELEDFTPEHVDDKAVNQFNGDKDSDEEPAGNDEAGSGLEDERSEFDYGDLEDHIMEDDEEDKEEDDLGESDFGAEDGEGAADNEDDYEDYGEY
jgi:hypothetical protein